MILIFSDIHFGAYENCGQFIEYQKKTMEWIYSVCDQHNIREIICAGDFFDKRKSINHKTLNFVKSLIRTDIKHIFIAGNHDVYYKNTNKINSLQNSFDKHKNIEIIDEIPKEKNNFILVPWVNSENTEMIISKITNSNKQYLIGHLELSNFEMMPGIMSKNDQLPKSLLKKFQQVITGHFHINSTKDNITYIGSPLELNWADCNTNKFICLYDDIKDEFIYIENPYRFFQKIEINDNNFDTNITYKDKRVRVIINCKRTIEIENYITDIIKDSESCKIIDRKLLEESTSIKEIDSSFNIKKLYTDIISEKVEEDVKEDVIELMDKLYFEVSEL